MKRKRKNKLVNTWYSKFNQQLLGFMGRSVKQKTDLQDMSQEIYLRMLRVKNPELIKSPKAYLFKVAIHVLDEWRNNNQNQYIHVDPDENLKADETNKYKVNLNKISSENIDLYNALSTIPNIYASALIMKWHYGKSYKEIARDMDISQRQVKRYIIKGYAELRVKLNKPSY